MQIALIPSILGYAWTYCKDNLPPILRSFHLGIALWRARPHGVTTPQRQRQLSAYRTEATNLVPTTPPTLPKRTQLIARPSRVSPGSGVVFNGRASAR